MSFFTRVKNFFTGETEVGSLSGFRADRASPLVPRTSTGSHRTASSPPAWLFTLMPSCSEISVYPLHRGGALCSDYKILSDLACSNSTITCLPSCCGGDGSSLPFVRIKAPKLAHPFHTRLRLPVPQAAMHILHVQCVRQHGSPFYRMQGFPSQEECR